MEYRREIDGLRALAVLPVIFFHAGIQGFRGGFVGVDIFFVISGYLITTILIHELRSDKLSILNFYERRARRILPALFIMMAVTGVFAYAWMMPDELKNFGQSVVATTFFSNNILLAMTSDYWSLTSEFKPLLHTWSLGVEEQYYIIFPLLLWLIWQYARKYLFSILCGLTLISIIAACWGTGKNSVYSFYLLPTRAWEILLGALVAHYLDETDSSNHQLNQVLSFTGLAFIVASICFFDRNLPAPSLYTLLPTLGAALIIMFATKDTVAGRILGSEVMVGFGLISYSLYLWHQPLFSLARVYSKSPPDIAVFAALIVLTIALAYLTWKFIETPFRNRTKIGRNAILYSSAIGFATFSAVGYFLFATYGMPTRIYDPTVATIKDLDKVAYNGRVFNFKKDKFLDEHKTKVLVIGNSFARDFVNMTSENFDLTNVEIVYRDDLDECISTFTTGDAAQLFSEANVIIFGSGNVTHQQCVKNDIAFAQEHRKKLFYIGPKNFGYNLNWLIRSAHKDLPNQYNPLPENTAKEEEKMVSLVPAANYISLLKPILKEGQIPITDSLGRLLSTDRMHVTKFGAKYIGEKALLASPYANVFIRPSGT